MRYGLGARLFARRTIDLVDPAGRPIGAAARL
jgi:hypothetical protein